jgi:hypothetical protein
VVVDGIVDAILADTNELQTDWANGGRLDLILDARSTGGAGAKSVPVTIEAPAGTPVDGVEVWISTDGAGSNVVANGSTDALGLVTFMLDVGSYYIWKQHSKYNWNNPETLTVT